MFRGTLWLVPSILAFVQDEQLDRKPSEFVIVGERRGSLQTELIVTADQRSR
jgi:hypothetical protein